MSCAALMFQGTGSDVGKTILVAGLCRALKNRGLKVSPFKPQNMSNNAAVAAISDNEEGEIGRGQYLQAMACSVQATVHMNPVLLKPQSQIGSQVVVQGKVLGNYKAKEYYGLKPKLLEAVMESYEKLAGQSDIILVEGAGSPAEINLRDGDIANMGFAVEADVPVVLIGDIDRGGVIASIVGTQKILPKEDREQIVGYVINKFRGDVSLFDDGLKEIRKFTGWDSFGVLPWLDAVGRLPAEDSVALSNLFSHKTGSIKVVVPVLGKIANFDDLDPLKNEKEVDLEFVKKGQSLPRYADLIILPGSKSTIADLIEFRENGWEENLQSHVTNGGHVIGICGGFQMLGKKIYDPQKIEGDIEKIDGLGLLDFETVLAGEKITRNTSYISEEFGVPLEGYEIHIGRSKGPACQRPMISSKQRLDGAISQDKKIRGCYLHGLFNSDAYRKKLLDSFGAEVEIARFSESVDAALEELANHIEAHLDVDGMLKTARTVQF